MRPAASALALACALTGACALVSCVVPADRERARALGAAVDPAKPFPESAFVESGGQRLHYRHWPPQGSAAGAALRPGPAGRILLLHGFGSSTFSFRFLVPELLAAGWEVAAVDIPPFGYSDRSEAIARLGFDRGRLAWAVPEALGWSGAVVLLGHSMGGQYAVSMAEAAPERVKALVLLAAAVPVDGKPRGGPSFLLGLFGGFVDSRLRSWSAVKKALESFAGESVPDAMVDGYAAPFQAPGGVRALMDWSRASARQAPSHPSALRAPTLLVWGEKDSIVRLEEGRKLAAAIPGSRLVTLPGLGHLAHELQSAAVDPLILDFLSALEE